MNLSLFVIPAQAGIHFSKPESNRKPETRDRNYFLDHELHEPNKYTDDLELGTLNLELYLETRNQSFTTDSHRFGNRW